MTSAKPEILIYYQQQTEAELLKELGAGIEEEGLLCAMLERTGPVLTLAGEAAAASVLGVGIGVSGSEAVLTLKNLPPDRAVFQTTDLTPPAARVLGTNSARVVKRRPFREL